MFRALIGFISQDESTVPLSELDCLYRETISQLPKYVRSAYCESLIHRSKCDMKCTACVLKRKDLNQVILAAHREIRSLSQN